MKKSVNLWLPAFKASEKPEASTSEPLECSQVIYEYNFVFVYLSMILTLIYLSYSKATLIYLSYSKATLIYLSYSKAIVMYN